MQAYKKYTIDFQATVQRRKWLRLPPSSETISNSIEYNKNIHIYVDFTKKKQEKEVDALLLLTLLLLRCHDGHLLQQISFGS